MNKNVGSIERIIRVIIGIGLLGFFALDGNVKWFGLLAIIPFGTAAVSW